MGEREGGRRGGKEGYHNKPDELLIINDFDDAKAHAHRHAHCHTHHESFSWHNLQLKIERDVRRERREERERGAIPVLLFRQRRLILAQPGCKGIPRQVQRCPPKKFLLFFLQDQIK